MLESHDTDGWHLHWSTAGTMWKVNHGLTGLTLLSMSSPGIRGRLWRCAPCEKDWDFATLSLLQHCYCYCHCYYEYCSWKVVMHRARIPSAEGQWWKGVREVSWYFQKPNHICFNIHAVCTLSQDIQQNCTLLSLEVISNSNPRRGLRIADICEKPALCRTFYQDKNEQTSKHLLLSRGFVEVHSEKVWKQRNSKFS